MPLVNAQPAVTCIVVNWNGAHHALACLEALALQNYPALTVVVVDNGSTDDSADRIERWIAQHRGAPMHLLRAGENRGFAAGNNAGMRASAAGAPEYFWLLNNDTVAPPDTLQTLIREATGTPTVGLVGTVLYYAHDPKRVQAWGGGHIDPETAFATHYTAPRTMGTNDYLTFASVLLRTDMLAAVGLLDERFFMYFEDAEFCLRAQRAGWHMAVAADTAVLHHEGGSGKTGAPSVAKERITTASALLLIRLYGHRPQWGAAIFLARRVAKRLLTGRWAAALAVVQTARR